MVRVYDADDFAANDEDDFPESLLGDWAPAEDAPAAEDGDEDA